MSALIAAKPNPAETQPQENAGIVSPLNGIAAKERKPATKSCTTVTRRLSTRPAKKLIKTISEAIAKADKSVRISPFEKSIA